MKISFFTILFFSGILSFVSSFAQSDSSIIKDSSIVKDSSIFRDSSILKDTVKKNYKIAVFSPLYLDSAFDSQMNYRYGANFPKFIIPGLEFYSGIQLAIDTLQKEGITLDVHVYDTRSANESVIKVIQTAAFRETDMVIGHVTPVEARQLAIAANQQSIPFINANYPNDAGVKNNPNFVVLNSTLMTHCEALYKYLQKHHSLSSITYFTKKGNAEQSLKRYFDTIARNTNSVPLKIKYVTLTPGFNERDVAKYLDSTKNNVSIGGSLDMNFALQLSHKIAVLNETYPSILFGMPTWDAADFTKPEYKNLEIYYGTPFYIDETNQLAEAVHQYFKSNFYARPSDMVFRGYETLYHFAHLLASHGTNISSSLSDKRHKIFTDFDIQPVINPKTMTLDYFENKKIYFVKTVDGIVKGSY